MKLTTPLLSSLLLLFLATGCTDSGEVADAPAGDGPVIGVSVLTMTHAFFQDLTEALEDEAVARGGSVNLVSCEMDPARQQNQVEDFIVKGVDAIILAPCDSKAIVTSIAAANEAGIPVFTADIAALGDGITVESHVATDNYEGGRLAATAVIDAIGKTGKVAIIDHPEVESVILRTRGFLDVVKETNDAGGSIDVVAQLPGGGAKDRSFKVAQDILQANPDVDAIFGINDNTALGAVAAIEEAGKDGQVRVIGFDGTIEARKAIRDGKIHADIVQFPDQIGRGVVAAVFDYMAGETVAPEQLIPPGVYTRVEAEDDPLISEATSG